jgi:hypothetical protein
LKAPGLKSVKNKAGKKLAVKIKAVNGATGYQVVYSTKANFKNKKTVNTKKTSVVLKKLKKGKKYYVKVRAYRVVDGAKEFSAFSAKKSVKVKK